MASKYRQELVSMLIEHMERQFRWGGPTAQLQLSYYEEALREAAICVAIKHSKRIGGRPSQVEIAKRLGINRNTLRKELEELNINLNDYDEKSYILENAIQNYKTAPMRGIIYKDMD